MLFKNHWFTDFFVNAVELIKNHNSSEIQIIEFALKKTEFYCDQLLITEYFQNCINIKKLWFIIMLLNFFFEKHVIFYLNNWTSISTSKFINAENLKFFLFFRFFSRFQINYFVINLLNNEDSKLISKKFVNIFDAINLKILHDIIRYLIMTNILIKMIMQISYHFDNIYVFNSENDIFISNFENLHRFYCLLQIWS